jgi:hypothetical protein
MPASRPIPQAIAEAVWFPRSGADVYRMADVGQGRTLRSGDAVGGRITSGSTA